MAPSWLISQYLSTQVSHPVVRYLQHKDYDLQFNIEQHACLKRSHGHVAAVLLISSSCQLLCWCDHHPALPSFSWHASPSTQLATTTDKTIHAFDRFCIIQLAFHLRSHPAGQIPNTPNILAVTAHFQSFINGYILIAYVIVSF